METIIEWQSPEHHFDRKVADWYWRLAIITIAIATLSFYFDNFLFAVFVIIASITVSYLSYKETRTVTIKITTKGILFGNKLYPFADFKSFWIEDDHAHGARVLLHPVSHYMPFTIIHINDAEVSLSDVHEILSEFLEEEFLQESFAHRLIDKLLAR